MSRTLSRFLIPFDDGALPKPAGKCLYLMASPGSLIDFIGPQNIDCLHPHRGIHDRLAATGVRLIHEPDETYSTTFLEITRSRDETRALIATAWAHTSPGGTILISGNKTDGIERHKKDIASFASLDGSASKSHGRVIWLTRADTTPPELAAWAKAGLAKQTEMGYWTAPGMFSAGRIDPGSQHLAQRFTPALAGRVADLGAGWGYLSAQLLANAPNVESVDLFEANKNALDAAQKNVTSDKAQFHWADVTALKTGDYDVVIMNPPFHQRRHADVDLGLQFVEAAARVLTKRGTLLMVANRHLPYETALGQCFAGLDIDDSDRAFKIITARRPRNPKNRRN